MVDGVTSLFCLFASASAVVALQRPHAYARRTLDNGPPQTRRYPPFYLFPQYITNFMICFEFMLNCIVSLPGGLTVFACSELTVAFHVDCRPQTYDSL